jgi:hypothetical protein
LPAVKPHRFGTSREKILYAVSIAERHPSETSCLAIAWRMTLYVTLRRSA